MSGRGAGADGIGEEAVGCRRGSGRESERTKKKEANCYLHNQWQMGNFLIQKPVKAGDDGSLIWIRVKTIFGQKYQLLLGLLI